MTEESKILFDKGASVSSQKLPKTIISAKLRDTKCCVEVV